MSEDLTPHRGPGRPPRQETVSEERRRRASTSNEPTLDRFGIDPSILDLKEFVYRAAEDRGMRVFNLTKRDDWDFVTRNGSKAENTDSAGVVRYQSGIVDGQAVYSYLLRKRKRYADADRKEKVTTILSDQKARLTQGRTDESELQGVSYVPKT